jgi:prolipoprotein diacylglyceryltransferase
MGLAGFAVAVALDLSLTAHAGLSMWVAALVIAICAVTSFAVAMATKIVTGEERHRYLHYEIAFLVTVPATLWLLGEPPLPYLDIALLGVGTVLAFGRIGCLMAGCCHGKPADWGACYRDEHLAHGFTPELAFVRLFPVQLLEALLVFALVAVGVALIASDAPAGSATVWYVMGYAVLRFALEYLRGDSVRSYLGPFSWVQWTVLVVAATSVLLEATGALPFVPWHAVALGIMALIVLAGVVRRPAKGLRHPDHLRELAAIVRGPATGAQVRTTSLGVSVTRGTVERNDLRVDHYTVSRAGVSERDRAALARLVARLAVAGERVDTVHGRSGVIHVLIPHDRRPSVPLGR